VAEDLFERWAAVLVDYSTSIGPGDRVEISGDVAAEPLLRAIYRAALRAGGQPVMAPSFSEAKADFFEFASDEQLEVVSPLEEWSAAEADVTIDVQANSNTRSLTSIDPTRLAAWTRARAHLRQRRLQRAAAGELRWASTIFPTPAHAQDADMATREFAALLTAACMLDQPDPIAAWHELSARQARMIAWLERREMIHLTASGTDLHLNVAGRAWVNSDGKRNFPSGEVFTGPVEDSAEGHIRFSYPVVTQGREVENVALRFAGGVVVDASATKNEDFLIATLDTDPGARRLGEFAFGTNERLSRWTKNILLDEKIGGTVHMALGAGYPETGSTNRSAIHWDFICDTRAGGAVTADGSLALSNGEYLI
jgi:aminopeptidase